MQENKFKNLSFSDRLLHLMSNCPLNQKELAHELKISEGSLINYKRNKLPKSEELYKISKYFGVTMEWLLTGDNSSAGQKTESKVNSYGQTHKIELPRIDFELPVEISKKLDAFCKKYYLEPRQGILLALTEFLDSHEYNGGLLMKTHESHKLYAAEPAPGYDERQTRKTGTDDRPGHG